MSQEQPSQDMFAQERLALDAERTLSAWLRTGLAAIVGGLGIIRFFVFKRPIFKTIYSLYSFNDLLQIVDPQGLYTMPKKAALSKTEHCWFSQRIFTQAPHVIQANLSINRRQPSHIAFISAHFMTLLPQILQTLSTLAKKAQLEHKEPHFTLNIVTYPTYQYTADYNIPGIL